MGFYRGPTIVRDGLVLHLDAANPKSYPGNGVIWKDLSGKGNDGTLINGPTFSQSNRGCVKLDGVDDYISIPNPINQDNLSQEWTVSCWINARGASSSTAFLLQNINRGLILFNGSGEAPLLYLNSGENDYYTYGKSFSVKNKGWMLVTYVFRNSDGLRRIFIDSDNVTTSGPNKTGVPSGVLSVLRIGGSASVDCDISDFKIYNRVLSEDEILQNYNATKTRFK